MIPEKTTLVVTKCPSDPALMSNDTKTRESDHPIKPRRKVHFDDVLLTKIIHLNEELDPTQIWYSRDELKETAAEVQRLVLKFRQQQLPQKHGKLMIVRPTSSPLPPELRGLEDLVSPQRLRCRRNRITQVVKGVQEEQTRQQEERTLDPLLISVRCQEVSKIAEQLAVQRARLDAREVAQFLKESS